MNFQDILDEEFVDYSKAQRKTQEDKTFSIFKNPSRKEIMDLKKNDGATNLRFIYDKKTDDVFVFSSDLLHHEAVSTLFKKGINPPNRLIGGVSDMSGKVKTISPSFRLLEIEKWLKKNDFFTYPNIDKQIESLKKKGYKLDEEFAEYVKQKYGEPTGIWKNPTGNDMRDLLKEAKPEYGLRFLVDTQKGDVYVFDAQLLHSDAAKAIFGGKDPGRRLARGYAGLSGKIDKRDTEYLFLNRDEKEKKKIIKALKKGGLFL